MSNSAPPPPPTPASPPPPPPPSTGPTPQHSPNSGQNSPSRRDNPIALAALVVSVAALLLSIVVLGGFIGLAAIVMAAVGLRRSKTIGTGRGLAIGAIVLSLLSIVASAAASVLLVQAIEDGTLSLEGFSPESSLEDFPLDDDLVDVTCTEDGIALAIISVENNTEVNQRYSVTVTWESSASEELLRGEARSDFIEPGMSGEIRIFERSSSAVIESCELESFVRSASLLN